MQHGRMQLGRLRQLIVARHDRHHWRPCSSLQQILSHHPISERPLQEYQNLIDLITFNATRSSIHPHTKNSHATLSIYIM